MLHILLFHLVTVSSNFSCWQEDYSGQEQLSDNDPSLGDMVVNERVDHVSRPSYTTRVTSNNIPKDMWAGALGQVFIGNALEQCSFHIDAFNGKYYGLKYALLQTRGFSTYDN